MNIRELGSDLLAADGWCSNAIAANVFRFARASIDRDDVCLALVSAADLVSRCFGCIGFRPRRRVVLAAAVIRVSRAVVVTAAASAGCK